VVAGPGTSFLWLHGPDPKLDCGCRARNFIPVVARSGPGT
jgi:hypothetical protein